MHRPKKKTKAPPKHAVPGGAKPFVGKDDAPEKQWKHQKTGGANIEMQSDQKCFQTFCEREWGDRLKAEEQYEAQEGEKRQQDEPLKADIPEAGHPPDSKFFSEIKVHCGCFLNAQI